MQNPLDLNRTIEQLKLDIQKELQGLNVKESAVKAKEAEKVKLEELVKNNNIEIRKKEVEILTMRRQIEQSKTKKNDLEREIRKMNDEVAKIKQEQQRKNIELRDIQRQYEQTLRDETLRNQKKS